MGSGPSKEKSKEKSKGKKVTVTAEERAAAGEAMKEKRSTISNFQFESLCKTVFVQADTNGDNQLSRDELLLVLGSPS